jgi:hypothetical protein
MYKCDDSDDCRDSYSCLAAADLGEIEIGYTDDDYTDDDDAGVEYDAGTLDAPLARNLDKESAKFCTVEPANRKK